MSSSSTGSKMARAKTAISTIGSIAAAAMVARSVAREYLPPEFQDYLSSGIRTFLNRLTNQLTMVIYEFDDLITNEFYEAAQLYLADRFSSNTQRLKITKAPNEINVNVSVESNEELVDYYDEVKFNWVWVQKKTASRTYYNRSDMTSSVKSDLRSFELTFHKKHKDLALNHYLPYVLKEANMKKNENKSIKIFTVDSKQMYSRHPSSWISVNLDHPATFDTLAMDSEIKETVMKDLERFVSRKEYYRKVGKAWKRGYLLYGPPGTGKSSLIAAMANYLNFDIYDLELTAIDSNSELRRLLLATGNRSILVVEDIDCSISLHDREEVAKARAMERKRHGHGEDNKVTLSGFLNFIDGLWSSCGDERIIIFTTNQKDKLDSALLRPGRMDMHIHMSYCTSCGFRLLVSNYLGIKTHGLFEEIEEWIATTEVTPAEVAEQLLKNDDPDVSLLGLIDFLHVKKKENEEAKVKKLEAEAAEKEKKEKEKAEAEATKKVKKEKGKDGENGIENGEPEVIEVV